MPYAGSLLWVILYYGIANVKRVVTVPIRSGTGLIGMRFSLPRLEFIGGTIQPIYFDLFTKQKQPFDLSGHNVSFCLSPYVNESDTPLLTKECRIFASTNGINNIAAVELRPEDTMCLAGKYIYQITITNESGDPEAVQGEMIIYHNIELH